MRTMVPWRAGRPHAMLESPHAGLLATACRCFRLPVAATLHPAPNVHALVSGVTFIANAETAASCGETGG
ncbi:hypothetical protein D3C71_1869460 [compost metagenome]